MTDDKSLALHHPSALDVYGDGDDIKRLAKRLQMCLPGGNRLNEGEALALGQLAITYNLNPFNGEVWYIPGKGTMVGIKGLRKAARKQAQYWVEHLVLSQTERDDLSVPDNAIAYKALIYRSDLIRQSAEAIKMMHDAGMTDAAERYAYKPTIGIGYWTPGEQTKMKPDQVARKRAEADALKIAFDLPFAAELGNGDRVGYIDAEEWEILPVQGNDKPSPPAPAPSSPPVPTPGTKAASGNGNTTAASPTPLARRPQDLLILVNGRLTVSYSNVHHLLQSLKAELGNEWTWPPFKDDAGWVKAYDAAIKHGKSKESPDTPAPDDVSDAEPLTGDELAEWFENQ